jgi:epoxyqueuosine reductase
LKGAIPEEFRPLLGNRIFGCDDCQWVCPWNRFAKKAAESAFLPREELNAPALITLMSLDEAAFQKLFSGSPIRRIKRRGLLRNVAVALGNTGTREALPVLAKAMEDPEPLIREHADWAVRQILAREKTKESSPLQKGDHAGACASP